MKKTLLNVLKHGSGILLTIFALLCSCQVWAWEGTLYFDNSATQWANVGLLIGHDTYRRIQPCSNVANTDVWYFTVTNDWGDETAIYWVNYSGSTSSVGSSAIDYAAGFQDRNITVNQISSKGGGSGLAGKIMKPTSPTGRSAGTTWVTYTESDYTSISGNGRQIYTNGYSEDTNSYAYIKVQGSLTNANYGENSQTLKGYYWNTGSGTGHITKASSYIGYNSTDNSYLYRFSVESSFAGLILLRSDAPTDDTSWTPPTCNDCDTYRYYCDADLLAYSGNTTCYFDLTGTVSSNQKMSQFTSLSAPTIASSASFGLIGALFTITLTKGTGSSFSGGDKYRVYASDGTNLYEICQPKTDDANISWSPTTAGDWTLYAVTTDKYGAERKKSAEVAIKVVASCTTPVAKDVSISPNVVCAGSNVTVTVDDSQDDYVYKVYDNSVTPSLMAVETGTGSDLSITFAADATATYTVYAVEFDGCPETTSMKNPVDVTVNTTPVITASATSVTNYTPVTLTATGANVAWSVSGGVAANRYLYKESVKGAMFKGTVGSGSDVAYTITGTASNGCSSAVSITVSSNTHQCR